MHLSPETKHKLVKAAPWILGGLVVAYVVYKMVAAKQASGGSTAQNLGAPGMQTYGSGQTVDQTAGATTTSPLAAPMNALQQSLASLGLPTNASSSQMQLALRQQQMAGAAAASQGTGGAWSPGAVLEKWRAYVGTSGQQMWQDISGKGRAPITELQAEQLATAPKGEGPYYQSKGGTGILGSIGSFVRNNLLGGQPVTLGNLAGAAAPFAGPAGAAIPRGTRPTANGTTRPYEISGGVYTPPFAGSNQSQQLEA